MPPLQETIILAWAPCAPLVSHRVWPHAQGFRLGARLARRAGPVAAAVRVMGWARACRCTNAHRVLQRATGSALRGRRML
jgi:hypothetical protein